MAQPDITHCRPSNSGQRLSHVGPYQLHSAIYSIPLARTEQLASTFLESRVDPAHHLYKVDEMITKGWGETRSYYMFDGCQRRLELLKNDDNHAERDPISLSPSRLLASEYTHNNSRRRKIKL